MCTKVAQKARHTVYAYIAPTLSKVSFSDREENFFIPTGRPDISLASPSVFCVIDETRTEGEGGLLETTREMSDRFRGEGKNKEEETTVVRDRRCDG